MPGARHDTRAWRESGLAARLDGCDVLGDLGYIGAGITTGRRKPPGHDHTETQRQANTALASLRSHNEHVIAHLKNWKMLSHRYRGPLHKLPEAVRAITALHFFRDHFNMPNE